MVNRTSNLLNTCNVQRKVETEVKKLKALHHSQGLLTTEELRLAKIQVVMLETSY